jgi:hypothetical protein
VREAGYPARLDGTAKTLKSLANAVALSGRAADSATLLGAAAALRERLMAEALERERVHIEAAAAAIRDVFPQRRSSAA